jgi:uncharacterized membrane protein YfcA
VTDFLGLGAWALAACFAGMFAGGTVKGVVGIGLPLVALPIIANFIPVPKAIALLLLSSFATSVWQTFRGEFFARSLQRLWPLLAGIFVGTWTSVALLAAMDVKVLYLILGTVVAAFASVLHRRLALPVATRAESWLAPLFGVASGLVGGLTMLFGPVYVMYLSGLRLGKDGLVAAIALANTWATIVLATAMARFDLIGSSDLAASLVALVPAFSGLVLGTWLRQRIDEIAFRKTLAVVLFLIALNLIRKGLM